MQNNKMLIGLLGCVFGLAIAVSACETTGPNPDYCWNADGDATCEAKYPGQGLFCSNETDDCAADGKFGCVAELPTDECYSPCGGGQSVNMNSDCVGLAGDSGSESGGDSGSDSGSGSGSGSDSETGTDSAEMACECESDNDCMTGDAALPLCNGCECVQCDADEGAVCASQWLACDADSYSCVPCAACDEQVCNHVTGQCLGGGLHVDGDGGRDFLSLQEAVDHLDGESGTIILHEVTGMNAYSILESESMEVGEGQALSIVAAAGEHPQVIYEDENSDNLYLLEVSNGSLYLSGFEIVGERGIQVDKDGLLHLVSMSVKTTGITVMVDDGEAFVTNSILRIEDSGEDRPAVKIRGQGILNASFTSIVGVAASNYALDCGDNTAVTIRNSLLGTLTEILPTDCPMLTLTLTTSYVEDVMTPMEADWFTEGDLRLDTDHTPPELGETAIQSAKDPFFDIDGDPRPPVDSYTFAGADLPTP